MLFLYLLLNFFLKQDLEVILTKRLMFILQVFNEDTRSLEISQSYTITPRVSSDHSAPCKRRKIELGWEVIKEHLQKPQNDYDLVPW